MTDALLADHARRVREIAAQVRELARRGEPLHIRKGGVHHFVPLPGDSRFAGRPVDVSGLKRILRIDPAARTARAEPGVTFAELVRATLADGLLPAVVPELEGITVGGAVAGCSVEAMSYRHGGFHDTCTAYELVTTGGEILPCSPEHEPLLFGMIHGSYGTLALLTQLEFRLVPAQPFVHLTYRTLPDAAAFVDEIRARAAAADYDFIDGIVHGPGQWVVCLGRFTPDAPRVSSYRGERIFYRSTAELGEDWLTTFDYCFRYDTECHWLTRTVPPLEWPAVRRAVGRWFLGSTNLIRWSNRLAPILALQRRPDVVCDYFVPRAGCAEFFRWYVDEVSHYPLWVVPYRMPAPYPWLEPAHLGEAVHDLFLDCAVYGKRNHDPAVDWSEALENKVYALGGIKTLISRNHHTRERFWSVYHQAHYRAAKRRLDPVGAFPDLFDKFHRGR